MADVRGAWNETGDKLTELGRKLKVHYEEQHGAEGAQSRQELTDAAHRVGSALQDAFEAIGTAARDKSVQADVKNVGQSLVEALGATLGTASEELRRAFSERKGAAGTVTSPDAATTAEPVTEAEAVAEPPVAEPPVASAAEPAAASGEEPNDTPPPKVEPWGTP